MSHRSIAVAAGFAAALLMPVSPAAAADDAVCKVGYKTYGDTSFLTAYVTITNTGPSTLYGWTLKFSLPAGQTFINGWEADFKANGQDVTGTSLRYNSEVAKGGSVPVGFNAYGSSIAPGPAEFRVNNYVCAKG